jgi:hypothetical protein
MFSMFGRRQALLISQGVPEAALKMCPGKLMFVMVWLRLAVLCCPEHRVDDKRK